MTYYDKYLKYKNKYLELKNMLGGSKKEPTDDLLAEIDKISNETKNDKKCIHEFLGIIEENEEREIEFLRNGGLINENEKVILLDKIKNIGLDIRLIPDADENLLWKLIVPKRKIENERQRLESIFKCNITEEEYYNKYKPYKTFYNEKKNAYINNGLDRYNQKFDRYNINYKANLSDHELIFSKETDKDAIVRNLIISLNVSFWKDVKNNIIDYITPLNDNINFESLNFNNLIKHIIKLKNQKIKNLLNQLINLPRFLRAREIIINIQEGYPTLYQELVCGIRQRDTFGIPTKLICKNLFESFTNISKDDKNIVVKVKDHIQKILNDSSSYNIGGRPDINTNLFSIVINNTSSNDGFILQQRLFVDLIKKDIEGNIIRDEDGNIIREDNEEILGRHIIQKQQEIGEVFIAAEPILLTCKIAQTYSRMVDYGVGIGSVIIKCDGLRLLFKGILNCHLEKDNFSFEHITQSLVEPNYDSRLKEITFGKFTNKGIIEDQKYIGEMKKTNIHLENDLYKEVIKLFNQIYFVLTPQIKNKLIKVIVGDFNVLRHLLELLNEGSDFVVVENKGLDYIIKKLN